MQVIAWTRDAPWALIAEDAEFDEDAFDEEMEDDDDEDDDEQRRGTRRARRAPARSCLLVI